MLIIVQILTILTVIGCDAAGYRAPPDLPERKIFVAETVVPDPLVRQLVQEEMDQGAEYTEDIRRLDLSVSRTGDLSQTGDDPRIETIEGIEQFRNLTYLDLRGQRLPGGEIAFIVGLVSLEELYLDGNRIDSSALERLTRHDRLRVLSARSNVIEEFPTFATLQNLETLDLSFNQRLRGDPRSLQEIGPLGRLVLQGTPRLDYRALEELARDRPDVEIVW
mgnify:CR=1 FL=1